MCYWTLIVVEGKSIPFLRKKRTKGSRNGELYTCTVYIYTVCKYEIIVVTEYLSYAGTALIISSSTVL